MLKAGGEANAGRAGAADGVPNAAEKRSMSESEGLSARLSKAVICIYSSSSRLSVQMPKERVSLRKFHLSCDVNAVSKI